MKRYYDFHDEQEYTVLNAHRATFAARRICRVSPIVRTNETGLELFPHCFAKTVTGRPIISRRADDRRFSARSARYLRAKTRRAATRRYLLASSCSAGLIPFARENCIIYPHRGLFPRIDYIRITAEY